MRPTSAPAVRLISVLSGVVLLSSCGAGSGPDGAATTATASTVRLVRAENEQLTAQVANDPSAVGTPTPAPSTKPSTSQGDAACGSPSVSYAPRAQDRPKPGAMPSGSTMATISRRGRLIAGISVDTLLFAYRNPVSGKVEGFDIDLLRAVSRAIFGDDRAIQYQMVDTTDVTEVLTSGEVDVVASTLTATCDRWKKIAFSSVYFEAGQRLLVRRDLQVGTLAKMTGRKVCASQGTTAMTTMSAYPRVTVVPTQREIDCLALFQQGTVDGIVSDDTILAGFVAQDPYTVVVGPKLTQEPYALGISAQHTDLVRFVNGVLEKARTDGTWKASYERWIGDRLGQRASAGTAGSPDPPQPRYGR